MWYPLLQPIVNSTAKMDKIIFFTCKYNSTAQIREILDHKTHKIFLYLGQMKTTRFNIDKVYLHIESSINF